MANTLHLAALRKSTDYHNAARAGIPHSTYYRWLNEQGDLTTAQVVALANVIGMTVVLVDKGVVDVEPPQATLKPGTYLCTLTTLQPAQYAAPTERRPAPPSAQPAQPRRTRYSEE